MTGALVAGRDVELLLFRIGSERFALPLVNAEEAVESLHHEALPGMPAGMLGIAAHRGRRLPVYATRPLVGVEPAGADPVTLVVQARAGRIGWLIDDVDDVIRVDLSSLRAVPGPASAEPVLRGVVQHGGELVAVCDPEVLVRACLGGKP